MKAEASLNDSIRALVSYLYDFDEDAPENNYDDVNEIVCDIADVDFSYNNTSQQIVVKLENKAVLEMEYFNSIKTKLEELRK